MPYELSDLDKQHAMIIEQVASMCRSNQNNFVVEDRLNIISDLLSSTSYHEIVHGNLCRMYSKVPIEQIPDACILVSTHVDTVNSIQSCHSSLNEETGIYTGTYDNAGTNAAAVIIMREENLPNNVVFAFTGDEETGACKGAREAAATLIQAGKHPFCIALDVTYEGFYNNYLISVENLVPAANAFEERSALKKIGKLLMSLEPDDTQTFQLIKKGPNHVPKNLPKEYVAPSCGMVDEAFAYANMGCPTMSLCVPCGNGGMHSQSGVKIKAPVMEGYILSLSSILYKMADYCKNIIFNKNEPVKENHEELLAAYIIARANLVGVAEQIYIQSPRTYANQSMQYTPQFISYDIPSKETDLQIFDDEDLQTMFTDAENWGEKEDFMRYATIPNGIFETLGIDPENECTEEEEEILRSVKEEIWDTYEDTMLKTYYSLGDFDEEREEDTEHYSCSNGWKDFQNDDMPSLWDDDFDNYGFDA